MEKRLVQNLQIEYALAADLLTQETKRGAEEIGTVLALLERGAVLSGDGLHEALYEGAVDPSFSPMYRESIRKIILLQAKRISGGDRFFFEKALKELSAKDSPRCLLALKILDPLLKGNPALGKEEKFREEIKNLALFGEDLKKVSKAAQNILATILQNDREEAGRVLRHLQEGPASPKTLRMIAIVARAHPGLIDGAVLSYVEGVLSIKDSAEAEESPGFLGAKFSALEHTMPSIAESCPAFRERALKAASQFLENLRDARKEGRVLLKGEYNQSGAFINAVFKTCRVVAETDAKILEQNKEALSQVVTFAEVGSLPAAQALGAYMKNHPTGVTKDEERCVWKVVLNPEAGGERKRILLGGLQAAALGRGNDETLVDANFLHKAALVYVLGSCHGPMCGIFYSVLDRETAKRISKDTLQVLEYYSKKGGEDVHAGSSDRANEVLAAIWILNPAVRAEIWQPSPVRGHGQGRHAKKKQGGFWRLFGK